VTFEQLWERERPGLFRWLSKRGLGYEDAEDVLQTTAIKALHAFPRLRTENFGGYVHEIAKNAHRDFLRKRKIRRALSLSTGAMPSGDSFDVLPYAETGFDLVEADLLADQFLTCSTGEQRQILLLIARGASYEDCSIAMGVPVGTIASKVYRARIALRAHLPKREEILAQ